MAARTMAFHGFNGWIVTISEAPGRSKSRSVGGFITLQFHELVYGTLI